MMWWLNEVHIISHGDNWYFSDSKWILFQLKIHEMVIEIKMKTIPIIWFLSAAHSGRGVLSCPTPSVQAFLRSSRSRYHSAAHNIQRISFIFGTANDLNMNPIDYGISLFIF